MGYVCSKRFSLAEKQNHRMVLVWAVERIGKARHMANGTVHCMGWFAQNSVSAAATPDRASE